MNKYIFLYLISLNIIEFLIIGIDKFCAIKKYSRISEKTLILFCLIGGSIGGINGMIFFRHKINKKSFYLSFPIISIIHFITMYMIINLY